MTRFSIGILVALFSLGLLLFLFYPLAGTATQNSNDALEAIEDDLSPAPLVAAPVTPLARKQQDSDNSTPAVHYAKPVNGGFLVTLKDESGKLLGEVDLLYFAERFDSGVFMEPGPGMPTVEQIFSRHGLRYRTDPHGQARIPSGETRFYLGIKTQNYFNYDLRFEEEDFELVGRPPLTIPCLVLDHNEKPAPDIPLYLGVGAAENPPWWFQERRTSKQGLADLQIFDYFRSDFEEEGVEVAQFSVKPGALNLTPQQQSFPVLDLPTKPLVFQLTPFGAFTVNLVSGTGHPLLEEYSVSVFSVTERESENVGSWHPTMAHVPRSLEGITNTGKIVFPRIGFGQSLIVTASNEKDGVLAIKGIAGPLKKGENISLNLYPEGMAPIFLGRVFNEEGALGKNIKLNYSIRNPEGSTKHLGAGEFRTDDEGRFQFAPKAKLSPGQKAQLTIWIRKTKNRPVRGIVLDISEQQQTGAHELGDVILTQPPVVARGLVLAPSGQLMPDATVHWANGVSNPYSPSQVKWNSEWEHSVTTNEGGGFELRGFPEQERIKLIAGKKGFLSSEMEIRVPEYSAVLQLSTAWHVKGKLVPNEHMEKDSIGIDFFTQDSSIQEPSAWTYMRKDGTFNVMEPMAPGIWEMSIHEAPFFQKTVELGPEGGELDLGTIDLQELYRPIRIHVKNEDGSKLHFISAWDMNGAFIGEEEGKEDGVLLILTPDALKEIYIHASDMRFQKVSNPYDGMEVILQAGYKFSLSFENLPELSPNWSIMADIVGIDEQQPPYSNLLFFSPPWGSEGAVPYPGSYAAYVSLVDLVSTGASAGGLMAVIPIGGKADGIPFKVTDAGGVQKIVLTINEELLTEAVALMHANQK